MHGSQRLIVPFLGLVGVIALATPADASGTHSKFLPGALAAGDLFGHRVAADGDLVVVGAPGSDVRGPDSGAAYVFERVGGVLVERATLFASTAAAGDAFGADVAIAAGRILVGAPGTGGGAGAAYLFTGHGATWTESQRLVAAEGAASDRFGSAVDIDSQRAVVGAPFADGSAVDVDTGAVYVFAWDGVRFAASDKLIEAQFGQSGDQFGLSVAMDGERIVAGAPTAYDGGTSRGRAAVFEGAPGSLALVATLHSNAPAPNGLEYGTAVAISGDRVVVTSPYGGPLGGYHVPGIADVHAFENGAWKLSQRLAPAGDVDIESGIGFGISCVLDGDRLVVGSRDLAIHGDGRGAAFVFDRTPAGFLQVATISAPDSAPHDGFAADVATSGDSILCGAPLDDDLGSASGAAWSVLAPPACCPGFHGMPAYLDVADPAVPQVLTVDVGPPHGNRVALILGSASGTAPGVALGAHHLPLVVDAYTYFTMSAPGFGPLAPGLVALDANGAATLAFALPPGLSPAFAGIVLHHAAAVFDPGSGALVHVTNAVPVTLTQ